MTDKHCVLFTESAYSLNRTGELNHLGQPLIAAFFSSEEITAIKTMASTGAVVAETLISMGDIRAFHEMDSFIAKGVSDVMAEIERRLGNSVDEGAYNGAVLLLPKLREDEKVRMVVQAEASDSSLISSKPLSASWICNDLMTNAREDGAVFVDENDTMSFAFVPSNEGLHDYEVEVVRISNSKPVSIRVSAKSDSIAVDSALEAAASMIFDSEASAEYDIDSMKRL